jgi:hypothetical protein
MTDTRPKTLTGRLKTARTVHQANCRKFGGGRRWHPAISHAPYSDADLAFLAALERWRALHENRRPELQDLIGIVQSLGYRRTSAGAGRVAQAAYDSALVAWQAKSGRRFPTWTEVFGIVQSLGFTSTGSARRANA